MLNIVPSCNPVQYQQKLMMWNWENGQKKVFVSFSSTTMQFEKLNWENSEKPNFGPNFGPFGPNLGRQFFFLVLLLLDVRHCCKLSLYAISRKTMIQTQLNGKKPNFGPDLGPLGPNSGGLFFPKSGFVT